MPFIVVFVVSFALVDFFVWDFTCTKKLMKWGAYLTLIFTAYIIFTTLKTMGVIWLILGVFVLAVGVTLYRMARHALERRRTGEPEPEPV